MKTFLQKLERWGHPDIKLNSAIYIFNMEYALKLRVPQVQPAYKWFMQIVGTEWKEVQRLWRMQSEDSWQRYYNWDEFDHRHMKLLATAIVQLQKKLRSNDRPPFYKKTKRDVWFKAFQEN
jgi:hypothetical protein